MFCRKNLLSTHFQTLRNFEFAVALARGLYSNPYPMKHYVWYVYIVYHFPEVDESINNYSGFVGINRKQLTNWVRADE